MDAILPGRQTGIINSAGTTGLLQIRSFEKGFEGFGEDEWLSEYIKPVQQISYKA